MSDPVCARCGGHKLDHFQGPNSLPMAPVYLCPTAVVTPHVEHQPMVGGMYDADAPILKPHELEELAQVNACRKAVGLPMWSTKDWVNITTSQGEKQDGQPAPPHSPTPWFYLYSHGAIQPHGV